MTIFDETSTLSNGVTIPRLALGTWEINNEDVSAVVQNALQIGYRHIDTAQAYGNEEGVGEGIKKAGIPRDQVFVNSKVAAEIKNYDDAKKSIDESLRRMKLDYLDMMIIHSPQPWIEVNQSRDRHFQGNLETWRAMEDAMAEGKLRAIGVSSFLKPDLDNIIQNSQVKPMVNQILAHVGHMPVDLVNYSNQQGIIVEAFSPIAHGFALKVPAIRKIAEKYDVSVAQLCIRYDWQLGMIVLPKAVKPEHIKANAKIDFEISNEDMQTLNCINNVDYGDASIYPVYGGKLKSFNGKSGSENS